MRKAIIVHASEAETLRQELLESAMLDLDRKIRTSTIDGQLFLEIPVTSGYKELRTVEQENPEYYRKTKTLKDRLRDLIPETDLELAPSGWQILGDIIVVNIDARIEDHKSLIAEKLLDMYPSCRTVVRDLGIEGQLRRPRRELIAGSFTETIHKENKCLFKLDVTKVMFSKGNLYEKKLMSSVGSDETIVDMFAGIGYFSIPIAVHACPLKIISIELNPESFAYLRENVSLNKVDNIIEPLDGDCAELTPQGIADRVIMGYVGTTHHYLQYGIRAIKKKGGMLHYHETTPESLVFDRPVSRIKEAALREGRRVEIRDCRRVKKYSPGVWHVVVDVWVN
ncbi:class I SAM-dependent methyltransferase family protein [Methanolobus halotolerans]|uniref:tRNA(Phe) (4-demethylwyosine(37)-C(7)) aminocarboxypropyltransferase n=1 Tax=Methanolobus halotolerans TaxID=2052935 RepID=A0A4E0Q5A0_9EURY|nr:class I SAM-dependent methyltransferase family protein [Methanolobus halotolerans]